MRPAEVGRTYSSHPVTMRQRDAVGTECEVSVGFLLKAERQVDV
jgi:hypothetical protein